MRLLRVIVAAGLALRAAGVYAQTLPAGPAEFAGGTIAVSGQVSATIGSRDDIAFFNYTDYEHNALRMFRFAASGRWRPNNRVAVLTDLRSEDAAGVGPTRCTCASGPWRACRSTCRPAASRRRSARSPAARTTRPTTRSSAIRSPIST